LGRILTGGVIGTLLIILAAAYLLSHVIDNQKSQSSSITTTPTSYTVMNLPLNNLVESGQLQVNQEDQITLNGQLHLNNATVLTLSPSLRHLRPASFITIKLPTNHITTTAPSMSA